MICRDKEFVKNIDWGGFFWEVVMYVRVNMRRRSDGSVSYC